MDFDGKAARKTTMTTKKHLKRSLIHWWSIKSIIIWLLISYIWRCIRSGYDRKAIFRRCRERWYETQKIYLIPPGRHKLTFENSVKVFFSLSSFLRLINLSRLSTLFSPLHSATTIVGHIFAKFGARRCRCKFLICMKLHSCDAVMHIQYHPFKFDYRLSAT